MINYYNQTEKELANKTYIDGSGNEHEFARRVWIDGNGQEREIWSNNKVIYLGEGTTFDIRSIYKKWNELTIDNFFFSTISTMTGSSSVTWPGYDTYLELSVNMPRSYENGILTFSPAVENGHGTPKVFLVTDVSKLIDLDEGMTFNVSDIQGYERFTEDNFLVPITYYPTSFLIFRHSRTYPGTYYATGTYSFIKSYNAETGQLTFKSHQDCRSDQEQEREISDNDLHVYINPKH